MEITILSDGSISCEMTEDEKILAQGLSGLSSPEALQVPWVAVFNVLVKDVIVASYLKQSQEVKSAILQEAKVQADIAVEVRSARVSQSAPSLQGE